MERSIDGQTSENLKQIKEGESGLTHERQLSELAKAILQLAGETGSSSKSIRKVLGAPHFTTNEQPQE